MNIITVDCGASFVKGALFKDNRKIRTVNKKAPDCVGSALECTDHIFKLGELVKNIVAELSGEDDEFYLCISNEMHGFILTDKDFKPVTDYISWQCDLGDTVLRNSKAIIDAVRRTGMPLRGSLPSCNLSYLISSGYLKGYDKVFFYTLGDYIIKYLSGSEPTISRSNAAATGLYDIIGESWNDELIGYIGAAGVIFPKVRDSIIDFETKGKRYHVFPAIGDQQAALLGAGLEDLDTLSFNLGTGAQVSRLSRKADLNDEWQVRPFFDGKYLITVPHIPSGRALNVYVRFIKSIFDTYGLEYTDESIWSGIMDSVNRQQTSLLKIDLGFFENAVNSSVKGSINDIEEYGLSMDCLFYAIVSQLADNCCDVAGRILTDDISVKKILFSGGVSQRFDVIRKRIEENFSGSSILSAKGDTLEGLCRYCEMMKEKEVKG